MCSGLSSRNIDNARNIILNLEGKMPKGSKEIIIGGRIFKYRKVLQNGKWMNVPVIEVSSPKYEDYVLECVRAMKRIKGVIVVHMKGGVSGAKEYGKDDIKYIDIYGDVKNGSREFKDMSVGDIESIEGSSEESATKEVADTNKGDSVGEVDGSDPGDSPETKHGSEELEVNNANIYAESSINYTWFVKAEIEAKDLFVVYSKVDANSTKEMQEREESIYEINKSLESDAKDSDLYEDMFTHEKACDTVSDLSGILF